MWKNNKFLIFQRNRWASQGFLVVPTDQLFYPKCIPIDIRFSKEFVNGYSQFYVGIEVAASEPLF